MHEDLMRKLAEFEPTEMPVLSVYLGMRPQSKTPLPIVKYRNRSRRQFPALSLDGKR